MSTWSATTSPRTRPPRYRTGSPATPGSSCISRRPDRRGSTRSPLTGPRPPATRPDCLRSHAWVLMGAQTQGQACGGGAMRGNVVLASDGHRVEGCGADGELVNGFLAHLGSRAFSPATVRAYAYDLLNFLRFLAGRDARLADVVAMDLFDYLGWQQRPVSTAGRPVVRLGARD